ncbi:hypothetical protein RHSIM_Rhsim09G0076100 [Rhododendron simsii]|uniref:Uncharacterized protein n=1 Tax=Rhododendron simsii TaxID=118357 RepID=A0A834LFH7_RHOSS|nr:hypothetical protein RHSIM_Rhsim09G0076100 [Rhododendron simsii]
MVEPRSGDSGISTSEPVTLVAGDFLETADPLDILEALGVDPSAADVLRGVGSLDARAVAMLMGVLPSQVGSETRVPEGGLEPEEMVAEERVTAVEEAKPFARESRPTISPKTYAPYFGLTKYWEYSLLRTPFKDPNLFPRGLVWNKEYRKTKERKGKVMTFRRWLDNLTGVSRTETYTRGELKHFIAPDTNLEGFLRRTMDYDAYKERYLAMSLGVEQELQRRVAEIETRRATSGTTAGGEQDHSGCSQRGIVGMGQVSDHENVGNAQTFVQVQMQTRRATRAQSQAAIGSLIPRLQKRRVASLSCGHDQRSKGNLSLKSQKSQARQRGQKSHWGLLIQTLTLLNLMTPPPENWLYRPGEWNRPLGVTKDWDDFLALVVKKIFLVTVLG